GGTTLVASLLFSLGGLINVAVFFLVLVYAATAVATWVLTRRHPECRLHVPAMGVVPIVAALASLIVGTGIPLADVGLGVALLVAAALFTLLDQQW
ncbi:MAG TPA: hypothetical protein VKX96_03270, partial [Chloroflexota bacterium]|nr:hypothetical protein [Chloroflexota bacterium]